MNFQKVLVPLDGSSFAEHALPLAMSVAGPAQARLELVTAVDPRERAADAEESRTYLDAMAKRIGATTAIKRASLVLSGRAAEQISEHAVTRGADLVVMATHGRGPFRRAWLGSVADELVRSMPVPLLLVRPGDAPPDLSSPRAPRRVVITLDGSPAAEQILDPAISLGALWKADIRLLRVVGPGTDPDETARRQDEAKAYLVRIWEQFLTPKKASYWNTRAVVMPDVVAWILKYADRRDDLVALTTRGLSGLDRLLIGSVADKVIRGSAGPVLVRRPAVG